MIALFAVAALLMWLGGHAIAASLSSLRSHISRDPVSDIPLLFVGLIAVAFGCAVAVQTSFEASDAASSVMVE